MNTKVIAAHYVFGVANKEIAKRDRTIASQAAEIERLRAALNEIMVGFIGSKEMREIARAALHPRALAGQDGG